ncbi:MAG: helix-turn-helix transcriptional regulator, partial [Rhodospirillales bacterium]
MDAKTLCLGVLALGDASGYEIKKHFEEGPFSHFHAAGYGSIYPALGALLADGLVTCTAMAQEGRPDKKVYSLTEAGRRAFRRELHKAPAADSYRSEAIFMMFFGELLDPDQLAAIYHRHLAVNRATVDALMRVDDTGIGRGRRFVRGLGLAVSRAVVAYMEDNRGVLFGTGERDGDRGSPP